MQRNIILLSVLLLLLPAICSGQGASPISQITQIENIGDTAEIKCPVQDESSKNSYTTVWLKVDRDRTALLVLSVDGTLFNDNPRFALRLDPSLSTYTLQIKDIEETDAGIYECQVALGGLNKISCEVELFVRSPPVISDDLEASLILFEGQLIHIECQATGYPHPTITWERENDATLPTGKLNFCVNLHFYA